MIARHALGDYEGLALVPAHRCLHTGEHAVYVVLRVAIVDEKPTRPTLSPSSFSSDHALPAPAGKYHVAQK